MVSTKKQINWNFKEFWLKQDHVGGELNFLRDSRKQLVQVFYVQWISWEIYVSGPQVWKDIGEII